MAQSNSKLINKVFIGVIASLIIFLIYYMNAFVWLQDLSFNALQSSRLSIYNLSKSFDQVFSIVPNINKQIEISDNVYLENLKLMSELSILKIEIENLNSQIVQKNTTPNLNTKPANVISISEKRDTILIDKGQGQNVKMDAVVIIDNYYVGKICDLQQSYSRVCLLTSNTSKMPALILQTEFKGFLTYKGDGYLEMSEINIQYKYQSNEIVVTAASTSVPQGLTIGKVSKLISTEQDIQKKILVEYPIKIEKHNVVFIVMN